MVEMYICEEQEAIVDSDSLTFSETNERMVYLEV